MASPRAILAAAKASPGAAQPTPPPQGSYPSYGMLPQYTMQPGNPYSPGYGPFMPRPPEDFTAGAFAPFSPILPVPVDQPPEGLPRAQPRRWQPYPGYNLPIGQPGTEGYKLASFQTLKALSEYYSVMRTCLEIRKNEIRSLEWDIVLTPDAAKAYRGDRVAMRDFGERRAKAKKFFRKPDPNYFTFSTFLGAMMDQVFVYDALSLYMCPKKGRGLGRGVLGSDLDCLWLLDGSTIRPLMDLHGAVPRPPAPGYQQYLFGVPRADLATMAGGDDLREHGLTERDVRAYLRGDQLLYLPYLQRPDSPYGFSIVEQAIIPIMTGLRKQAYQLEFFSETSVPAVYISPGDVNMTPNQVRELQDALNAVAGDIAWRYKVIVLPPGSKTMPQKDIQIVDDSDTWIATEVAMVANISPIEIGIIPQVSAVASPFAAREMSQAARSIHQRSSTKPTMRFVADIMDVLLQVVMGQQDMRWMFSGMEETQDLAAETDIGIKQAQSGVKSIDEVRDTLGLTPWGLPETSGPVVFTTAGPLPLGEGGTDTVSDDMAAARALTPAHAGAEGAARQAITRDSPPRKAIPAGASGVGRMNGPVTQRQARRGGALAPAHATAEGAPGRSGGKPVPKAAAAELEALARHLRKGRRITTWEREHLPEVALAVISEDLAKGMSVDQAVESAKTVVLPAGAYEWLPKAQAGGGGAGPKAQQSYQSYRAQQQALAAKYSAQVKAAFTSALTKAAALIAQWAAGLLTVTLAVLIAMIIALIRKALTRILRRIWRAAWKLGQQAAAEASGGKPDKARSDEALAAFLATFGEDLAGLISATRLRQLAEELTEAVRSGRDPQDIAAEMERILRVASRADMIAATEASRAAAAAALQVYKDAGIAYKVWRTSGLPNVCPICQGNQDAGPIPLSAAFPSGALAPPQHPNCQCFPLPWVPQPLTASGPVTGKGMRRAVPLIGEVAWEEDTPGAPNAAGGGMLGRPVPHGGDGRVQLDIAGGVPGATAGGEPPRWDASEPVPHLLPLPSGDDGQAMGGERGTGARPGTYWPAPYMDGWWPAPHGHGTQQPPASSVGGGPRGRAPNAVGKGLPGWLASAPKAKPATVFTQMEENYPPGSIAWIKEVKWRGPLEVPLGDIDWDSLNAWAAHHQMAKVEHFMRLLADRQQVNPAVGIIRPGERRVRIVDGHHRSLACRHLGWPSRMYVGWVTSDVTARQALETHLYQIHQGADPANKMVTLLA